MISKIREYKSYAKMVNNRTVYLVPKILITKNGRNEYIKWNIGVTDTEYEQTFDNFDDAWWAFNKVDKEIINEIKEKIMQKIQSNSNDPLFLLWLGSTSRK